MTSTRTEANCLSSVEQGRTLADLAERLHDARDARNRYRDSMPDGEPFGYQAAELDRRERKIHALETEFHSAFLRLTGVEWSEAERVMG